LGAAGKAMSTGTAKRTARPANQRVQQLDDRRQKIIAAAEQLFLARGYAGASVNQIVRIAGGSLATLYAEFGTKEKLFEAVMTRRASAAFEGAQQTMRAAGTVTAELQALAARIQERTLSSDSLALYRLAVAEGPRFAALRKAVLTSGMQGFLTRLAGYFGELTAAGRLRIDVPGLAAERFLALVQGQQQFIAGCGDVKRYTPKVRTKQAADAVDAFLRIYPPPRRVAQA
jgi:AcrR family transcriptional regulator